ncbi:MAG: type II secretion system F family protein [Chloroflexi bacterium]|nr:type II secretion system F family protein [Chloroflexota bacterium]
MEVLAFLLPLSVFAFVFLLVLGIYGATIGKRQMVQERLDSYVKESTGERLVTSRQQGQTGNSILREKRLSSIPSLDTLLKRLNFAEEQAVQLARADVHLRVGEYLLIRVLSAAFLFALTVVMSGNVIIGFPFAALGFYIPWIFVKYRRSQRYRQFNNQLIDALDLMANALKSGNGFLQAMELASRELAPPIASELGKVLQEVAIGSTVETALSNLNERMESDDLDLIVTSFLIQRRTGGNLAEILDRIAHTIRERIRIVGEAHALTTEVRLSGWILGLLPVGITVLFYFVSPEYMSLLWSRDVGKVMIGFAVVMQLIGFIFLRKLATIEV